MMSAPLTSARGCHTVACSLAALIESAVQGIKRKHVQPSAPEMSQQRIKRYQQAVIAISSHKPAYTDVTSISRLFDRQV